MQPESPGFSGYQAAFAARIRDPKGAPRPPGAPARRMRVYEELLLNNLDGFLLACYPVTHKLLGVRAWQRTVRRFFVEHRCHSPLFRDIPKAFLDWMNEHVETSFPCLPFLSEFMHYEWLELKVSISPEEPDHAMIDPAGDLLSGHPALDPSAHIAFYHYPVHRISPLFRPKLPDEELNCYLLFRDRSDIVRFITLNKLSARLVSLIQDRRPSGHEALMHLARQARTEHHETYLAAGGALLAELHAQGALLGTWKEN